MSATTVTPTREARARNRTNRRLWAAQFLLAAFFVLAAVPMLAGAHSAVQMFGQIGAGQWLRYLVGPAELAGATGLLIPRLAGLARPGWPPTWSARPSSTPRSCTVPPSR